MTTTIEPRASHDVRDRRRTNMEGAIAALNGAAADLTTFAGNPGISYLVAERLERLARELEGFRARDLLSQRAVS